MGFTKYTSQKEKERIRMNEDIRAPEVRVIGPEGENFGVMKTADALSKARESKLDLIEVTAQATPPVVKIIDYGKYKYEQKRKDREARPKTQAGEVKTTQVKIGTSERDMHIKASKAALWMREGHRVKIDLFLWGRYKYMEFPFLKERLERFLAIVPESFKIADEIKKSPKGLSVVIELDKSGKKPPVSKQAREKESRSARPSDPTAEQENPRKNNHENEQIIPQET